MKALLISTYEMGRQPFGMASAAAWLKRTGCEVTSVDVTRDRVEQKVASDADLVGFYLPMHTATRLAVPVIDRVRTINPSAHLCAYGLYAPLNEPVLREHGVETILGPEFEPELLTVANDFRLKPEATDPAEATPRVIPLLPRVAFITPDRSDLPPLTRYASLQVGGERRTVGYTEATRGCKHRCRHCPIVPVYDGRFRAVAADVVLADIRAQVAAGAQHITFGDPDFFNGPTHALAIVDALAGEFPGVSYDATIKVEHLKQQAALLPRLVATGCAFVTTAVESFDDQVLEKLEKGHTHAEFVDVVRHCASIGLALSPTFVAFTPWTTIDGYLGMLREIDRLGLVGAVSPIQYAIRLLIPQASRMLELDAVRARVERFDPRSLTCIWKHADPRVDALQQRLEQLVGSRLNAPRDEIFAHVWEIAHEAAGAAAAPRQPLLSRAAVPYLNEPWYC